MNYATAAAWMGPEVIVLRAVSQAKTNVICHPLWWNVKKKKWVQMNLSAKEKQTHRHRE